MNRGRGGECGKPAIAAGDDVLATHQPCVLDEPLRNQFGVLDVVGGRIQNTGNQQLAFGKSKLFEQDPLVGMTWIGRFEEIAAGRAANTRSITSPSGTS